MAGLSFLCTNLTKKIALRSIPRKIIHPFLIPSGRETLGVVAQLVRAPPCHGGGCGFEPRQLRGGFFIISMKLSQQKSPVLRRGFCFIGECLAEGAIATGSLNRSSAINPSEIHHGPHTDHQRVPILLCAARMQDVLQIGL